MAALRPLQTKTAGVIATQGGGVKHAQIIPRPAAREGADRAEGSEFLGRSSNPQNSQLNRSGQDMSGVALLHDFGSMACHTSCPSDSQAHSSQGVSRTQKHP